jgi:hypothetical protein
MQQLYELELLKIPVLAAGNRVRQEQDAVYRRLATERGLPAQTLLNVNMKTGEVRLRATGGEPEQAEVTRAATPAPEEAAPA